MPSVEGPPAAVEIRPRSISEGVLLRALEEEEEDIVALLRAAPEGGPSRGAAPGGYVRTTRRVRVGRAEFDAVTMPEAVERIAEMAALRDRPRHVCTGNLDHLAVLERDPRFAEAYGDADLVLADGMPVIWLSRMGTARPPASPTLSERVAGSDLFWELGRASAERGLRLFLLGGMPGAADRAAEALAARHPGVVVCGTYCPPHEEFATEEEQARIAGRVRAARPDVLLVGLGAPKQEKWILERKAALCVPVCIGVGGSFEMAAGMVRRAPLWMQRSGLEWSYRLVQDPARLWRRYLCRDLPVFVSLATKTALSRARRTDAPASAAVSAPTPPPSEPPGKGQQHQGASARITADGA